MISSVINARILPFCSSDRNGALISYSGMGTSSKTYIKQILVTEITHRNLSASLNASAHQTRVVGASDPPILECAEYARGSCLYVNQGWRTHFLYPHMSKTHACYAF